MGRIKNKERALSKAQERKANEVVRSNNKRALVIHFLLSIVGFAAFLILATVTDSMGSPYWATMATFYFVVVCGLWVYFLCGYFFLRSNGEKAYLSVNWLAAATIIVGFVSAVGFFIQESYIVPLDSLPYSVSGIMVASSFFLNTLGFGIVAMTEPTSTSSSYGIAVGALSFVVVSILPSTLLWLGLRLRMKIDSTEEPALDDNHLNREGVHG